MKFRLGSAPAALVLLATLAAGSAQAGGGYFLLGYGPMAHQSGGTATAIGFDGFAGATNPGKLAATGNRLDLGLLIFSPHRRIERENSEAFGGIYNFSDVSRNTLFFLPEVGYVSRINEKLSWGLTLYGNGGLNTEYRENTGVPGSNGNPAACGDRPGNFFGGCGKAGFDLSQAIIAPTLGWKLAPKHSLGLTALVAYQQIKVYGLQAFQGLSEHPDSVTNQGYDSAFGAGLRLGWYGQITSWLDLGASYATRVQMQDFDEYKGLFADSGAFDIPSNFSLGAAFKPAPDWIIGVDLARVFYGEIKALQNGVQDSTRNPPENPLGSSGGSGFNWRHVTFYKAAISYAANPKLTLRAGYAYSKRAPADDGIDSVSLNLFAPSPKHQATAGFSYALSDKNDLHFAYGRYIEGHYEGPSATPFGGTEAIDPYVDTFWLGWSRHL